MINFGLCYQIPNSKEYIAPQLLTLNKPAYEFDPVGGLVRRYTYDFMPKGIITQFIVALNHLIEDQDLVWRTGVVLSRENARAEISESYDRRKIDIHVIGEDIKELLAIITHELDKIHNSYHNLNFSKWVPCICKTCTTSSDPHLYEENILNKFLQDGQQTIQCQQSYEMVQVTPMVDDILDYQRRLRDQGILDDFITPAQTLTTHHPTKKSIFLSYAWGGDSEKMADQIEQAFNNADIPLTRDKRAMGYKDRIQAFMQRLGRGHAVVAIISKKYLQSINCMFELLEIAKQGNFEGRIFPIVLEDANIYSLTDRMKIVAYWKKQIEDLEKTAQDEGLSLADMMEFSDEVELYIEIRQNIKSLADVLKDMNTLSVETHQGSNFSKLIEAVQQALAD
jgi:hypothetical protein